MTIPRSQKLAILQEVYKQWTEKYPDESDDDADSHLYEMQQEAFKRAETEI
jgi:hypothetical protein